MSKVLYFSAIVFLACSPIKAQEKPLWEALVCDTTQVITKPLTIRSIVVSLYKNDTLPQILGERLIYGEKNKNKETQWVEIKSSMDRESKVPNGFLDSLSYQYLRLLLPKKDVVYERWEPWISPVRKDFLIRRDSLLQDLIRKYTPLKFKISSDIRTNAEQKIILQKGYSQAHLSFHEMGLASDFSIYKQNKYLSKAKYYTIIGDLAKKHNLTWGGNFVGFEDVPHVQYYLNSAELIRKHPYLAIEYDFFYDIYVQRVRDKIAKGEEYQVEDSKELLLELNQLRKKEPCFCEQKIKITDTLLIPNTYIESQNLWIHMDYESGTFMVKYPNQALRKFKIGVWK